MKTVQGILALILLGAVLLMCLSTFGVLVNWHTLAGSIGIVSLFIIQCLACCQQAIRSVLLEWMTEIGKQNDKE